MEKKFVGVKPRTTIYISENGYERFNEYLTALSDALEQARRAMPEKKSNEDTAVIKGRRIGI